ncbi:BlaI/MecI/CopY family transcriptional regulator [Candidatus Woesearchaeota archaeon]|nr:BlaI/MecI/CopY family transcriptional regulator [Candidatus Woesearchaeota archaeon]
MNHDALQLSPLEKQILEVLWQERRLKVRNIHDRIKGKAALTSVAVALDRLHKEGIVGRSIETGRGGLRYVYFPEKSRQEFEQSVVERAVKGLVDRFGTKAVAYFAERFERGNKK